MRKSIKTEVSGNLALKPEKKAETYSSDINAALLENAVEVNGVKYCTLPVELLRVDTYQRPIQKKVREIATKWDPAKAGTIKVSYRDGDFWVVDGQNRMEAAKLAGVRLLYCQISTDKTKQEETMDFVAQNENVVLISSFDQFNALINAGEPSALKEHERIMVENALIVKRACDKYKVGYRKERRSTAPVFGGMSAIMDACDKHGESGVKWILDTINRLGWHNDRKAYCNSIIRALSNVYGAHDDKTKMQNQLVRNIDGKRHTPDETIIRARCERPSRGETLSLTQFFESVITD